MSLDNACLEEVKVIPTAGRKLYRSLCIYIREPTSLLVPSVAKFADRFPLLEELSLNVTCITYHLVPAPDSHPIAIPTILLRTRPLVRSQQTTPSRDCCAALDSISLGIDVKRLAIIIYQVDLSTWAFDCESLGSSLVRAASDARLHLELVLEEAAPQNDIDLSIWVIFHHIFQYN